MKSILELLLPRYVFLWLRNMRRKHLRSKGNLGEVYISGFPVPRWVNGKFKFKCRRGGSDGITFQQVFVDQEYNLSHLPHHAEILSRYDGLSQPIILDLGANIGAASAFLAESFPKAKIIAVEPDVQNFELLRENTSHCTNVVCVHGGAAADDGKMEITNPDASANAFQTKMSNGGSVLAYSLQSLLKLQDGDPFFLKVDIEGAESDLFRKNWDVIDRFPVVAVEIHDWLYRGQQTSHHFLSWHVHAKRELVIRGEMLYSIAL